MFFAGCAAFALFFLGDLNDLRIIRRIFALAFPSGCLLFVISAAYQTMTHAAPIPGLAGRIAAFFFFACFFLLEIHTLFFALPSKASYLCPGQKRPVCRSGVYALCRHPGVLWFGAMTFFLWMAAGFPLLCVVTYTILDVGLVWFEDAFVFPSLLEGYEAYRADTPFLIPTLASIRRSLRDHRTNCEETDR